MNGLSFQLHRPWAGSSGALGTGSDPRVSWPVSACFAVPVLATLDPHRAPHHQQTVKAHTATAVVLRWWLLLAMLSRLVAGLRVVLGLGTEAAAAHGVAIQVEALGYMPGGAFQISAATLAGQYLGAKDLVRARNSVIMACPACSGRRST